ncbi:MAG TPA: hypothetical protein DEB46_06720 [Myxococcales bacterium]|nr:hypothetical protein [Myxococcales bacterium]MBF93688.1 hypothetical protein [Myxococcales bacterium]HBU47988.1 hypothetical protein [Myxococcales bacterium]
MAAMVLCLGCHSAIEAPTDFDELLIFLFDHFDDEDTDHLVAGVENLVAYVEGHRPELKQGYVVDNLSSEVVEEIEGEAHDLTDLLGVAFTHDFQHSLQTMVDAQVLDDPMVYWPGKYEKYDKSPVTDRECFLANSCPRYVQDTASINNLPLGLTADVEYRAVYRWIETSVGPAMVQRNHLLRLAKFNWDWIEMEFQYYLGVQVELEADSTNRTEATWMLANMGESPIPVDLGIQLALDSMRGSAEAWDVYLETRDD